MLRQFVTDDLLLGTMDVSTDEDLLTTGLLDSIGVIRLTGFIEEQFSIHVPPEDVTLENFSSLEVIDGYLDGRET